MHVEEGDDDLDHKIDFNSIKIALGLSKVTRGIQNVRG
jgi:hypothetical protein